VTQYDADEMTFRAEAPTGGFMVASEVYEEGWNAYLDGEEVEMYETNGLFRGVVLPPGEHKIEMRYEPVSLTIGLWTSGLFSLAAIGVWLFAAGYWLQGIRRPVAGSQPAIGSSSPPSDGDDSSPPPGAPAATPARKIVFRRKRE